LRSNYLKFEKTSMAKIFTPLKIRNTTFKNRMAVSPMCMYSSEDGFATDFHLTHLGSRAVGGFGLIIQEATAVSPEGRITYKDLGIWKDEHIPKLKDIVKYCQLQGSLMGIQLGHAGRKASHRPPFENRAFVKPDHPDGWQTVSSSALPFQENENAPIALDEKGIQKVKDDFVAATKRAKAIGYDVLEIHAAHGYLLHQFYSPKSNKRTDRYGGSFENRIRLLLEITELVKAEWGSGKPLFVRISATDWVDDGWKIEDSIKLSTKLKNLGVDLIDTSAGGNLPGIRIELKPGYQVPFAEIIKKEAEIKTGAVGLITQAKQAEEIIAQDQSDLVFFGREALRNPYLPLYFAKELKQEAPWTHQYFWAVGQ